MAIHVFNTEDFLRAIKIANRGETIIFDEIGLYTEAKKTNIDDEVRKIFTKALGVRKHGNKTRRM